ncbi:MAG: molecular chaperone HtpG [Actinomycetia bacterium]|nr:molecular chaperone HtpG [Actinomycetes bacterium]
METLKFQAETDQLLQLMVHSIYSNKDVFLRELISNAADALDKLRLETVRSGAHLDAADLGIQLEVDREQRTLTVRDNGIGMSRDELVDLVGTIARSGTAEFLGRMQESKDSGELTGLIGQFGVGFYSSFMVADKVTLVTRRAGEADGTRWESAGRGTYMIDSVDDVSRGTTVTLHLKPEDAEDRLFDYTAGWKIRELVKRYCDFVTWPITMADDGEPQTLNSMKPLWARTPSEITDEEYTAFYAQLSHDWEPPLETIHVRAEGTFEYQALLFIPAHAPVDLAWRGRRHDIQLYMKRTFIMDDCEGLMPEYLRFVKGVVDAQDLSLNVSREFLQQDRQIQLMRRRLVKKTLSRVREVMNGSPDRYLTFWREFGLVVKEGLLADPDNREAILDIASFGSTHDLEQLTTLRAYLERMPDSQEHLYYLVGTSREAVENSPHMEAFRAKDVEVLILTDRIDEMWVTHVGEFDGRRFQSIAKGQVDLQPEDEQETRVQREDFADLLPRLAEQLNAYVKEVRLSGRLTTSPACIVGETTHLTPSLEKMYRAMGQPVPTTRRILELNPEHPLVLALKDSSLPDADLTEMAELLYGMALLAEGGDLPDPARFTRLMAERLARTL